MTVRVIKPAALTPAMLISSTAVDAYAAYNPATTYALNDQAQAGDRVWKCIQAPSTGNTPSGSPLWWLDVGPTNTQAMFDSLVSTQTEAPATLTVVLAPGYVNSLGLFGLECTLATITVHNGHPSTGELIYSRTVNLDGTMIADWYQYFFEPSVQLGDLVLTDLPPYVAAHITISLTGPGTVRCGILTVGTAYTIGLAEYGATIGIIDYSRKTTDVLGATSFTKRAYSKRVSVRIMLDNVQLNNVQRTLADQRATPAVWIVSDVETLAPLNVYGFYRDFSLEVAYPTQSYCSLEIESLV